MITLTTTTTREILVPCNVEREHPSGQMFTATLQRDFFLALGNQVSLAENPRKDI